MGRWHPELQNSVFQFRWDFKLSPVLVGVLASNMMRGRERESITGDLFILGQEESCRQGIPKFWIPFLEFFDFCFVLPALKRKLYSCCCNWRNTTQRQKTAFLLLQLKWQHLETQKKQHPCCCKLKKHHLETKKSASLLLQIQETPPRDQKKDCILVAANSWNTTQRLTEN